MSFQYFELVSLGVLVGSASAILGVGGGVFIVPILPLIFAFNQKAVIATSLLTAFVVVVTNSIGFHRRGLVNWGVAIKLGPIAALMAFFWARVALKMPDRTLKTILTVILFSFAVQMMIEAVFKRKKAKEWSKKALQILLVFVGLLCGTLAGLTGLGSGILLSPIFIQFNVVSDEKVAPTSNAVVIFTSFAGVATFLYHRYLSNDLSGRVMLSQFNPMYAVILAGVAVIVASLVRPHQAKIPRHIRKALVGTVLLLFSLKEAYLLWLR